MVVGVHSVHVSLVRWGSCSIGRCMAFSATCVAGMSVLSCAYLPRLRRTVKYDRRRHEDRREAACHEEGHLNQGTLNPKQRQDPGSRLGKDK